MEKLKAMARPFVYLNWYAMDITKEVLRLMNIGWTSFGKSTFYTLPEESNEDDPEDQSFSIATLAPKVAGTRTLIRGVNLVIMRW